MDQNWDWIECWINWDWDWKGSGLPEDERNEAVLAPSLTAVDPYMCSGCYVQSEVTKTRLLLSTAASKHLL